jgi:predicted  nucleic acid-binding Zn-ribbon protein
LAQPPSMPNDSRGGKRIQGKELATAAIDEEKSEFVGVATKMDDGDKQQIESMQAVLDGKYQLILTFEADRQELNIYNSEQDTGTMQLNGGRNSVLLSSVQEIEGQQFSVQIDLVARRRCIAFQTAQ